ncbi:MAG: 5'-methylthioadenosine/S-adenosylhomocysteine nucleosidase [Mycoplasmataceae bacterium]|jgi:adenosylhomocysteine nucleosidase|nr:5'-methylthioadenosine/S-adenosylhomocysteine nucleosidase [Mycoplasmataceae bacterium]
MIGFVIALKSEVDGLFEKMSNKHTSVVNGYEVYIVKILNSYIHIIFSGVGKVNATMATQTLIDHFKIKTIINVGSCGSLVSNLKINDLFMPTSISYNDVDVTSFGYKLNQIPNQPEEFVVDQQLFEKISSFLKGYPHPLLHGKLVSGETFLSQNTITKFSIDEKAMASDMESAAIAQTCLHNNIKLIVIKVVSDSILHQKNNANEWTKNIQIINKVMTQIINDIANFLIYNHL